MDRVQSLGRLSRWLLPVLTLSLLLAGCGGGSTPAAPDAEQVLRLNLGEEPPSLDPQRARDALSFDVLNATQEGLVRLGEHGRLEKGSGLAADWSVSADGTRYTFTLKEGLLWSDGEPITAHDFVYAWRRALDPRTAAPYAYQLYYLKGGFAANNLTLPPGYPEDAAAKAEADAAIAAALDEVGVWAGDDRTLEVELAAPTPYFVSLTAFATYLPVRADLVEKYGDRFGSAPDRNAYSGPFVISSWQHEASLRLARNERYWDAGTVQLDGVHFVMVKDANTFINMYEAGELDATGIPGDFIPAYKDKGLKTRPDAVTFYLEFNTTDSVLQNAKVRRALALALDREGFVDNVIRDGSLPATGLVPPAMPGLERPFRAEVGDLLPARPQLDEARVLLDEGLRELGHSGPLRLTLLGGDSPTATKFAQAVQAFWQQNLGIQVDLESVAFMVGLDRIARGEFQINFGGWGADYNDPMTFLDLFVTDGGNNNSRFSNAEFDRLIEVAKFSGDQAERMAAMAAAETILMQEMPVAPLFFRAASYVEKPYVQGIIRHGVGAGTELKWAHIKS